MVEPRSLVLREPLHAAWGELREREILEVTLRAHDGAVGRGEAAPLEPYDGVAPAAVQAALDVYAAVLEEADMRAGRDELLALCAAERPLPQALAAIDLALWDMAGQRAGQPVAALLRELLGDDSERDQPFTAIPVNALLSARDRSGAAAQAVAATVRGFTTVKAKVGIGDDSGRLAAIRAAVGPAVRIRVDANGSWADPAEALANLSALAPIGLELCEEPVRGVEALRSVAEGSPIPIAMDETDDPGSGATPVVCLKISRSGGITGALRDAKLARAAGSTIYFASTFDGPAGIAAALHAAAATGTDHACGLATLDAFFDDDRGLRARNGTIGVPAGPGLLG